MKITSVSKRKYNYFVIKPDQYSDVAKKIIDHWLSISKWNKNKQQWEIKISYDTARNMSNLASKLDWDIDDATFDLMRAYLDPFKAMNDIKSQTDSWVPGIPDKLNETLTPLQRVGAHYMAENERCFNCDEMGVGKTIQTLSAIESNKDDAYPVLIVARNIGIYHWRMEISKWIKGRKSIDIRNGYHNESFILANYESVARYKKFLDSINIGTIVLDESTEIKNRKRKDAKAVKNYPARTPEFHEQRFGEPHHLIHEAATSLLRDTSHRPHARKSHR